MSPYLSDLATSPHNESSYPQAILYVPISVPDHGTMQKAKIPRIPPSIVLLFVKMFHNRCLSRSRYAFGIYGSIIGACNLDDMSEGGVVVALEG